MHSNNYIFQTAWIIFSLRHNHWQNCPGRFTWIQHNTKLNKRAVCYNSNTILKYILNRIKWNKTIRCTVAEHQHRRLSFHFSYTQWKTKTLAVNVEHATFCGEFWQYRVSFWFCKDILQKRIWCNANGCYLLVVFRSVLYVTKCVCGILEASSFLLMKNKMFLRKSLRIY